MRKFLFLFVITVAVGLFANFYSSDSELRQDKETLSTIQQDFLELDEHLLLLLQQIDSEQLTFQKAQNLWTLENVGFVLYKQGLASKWTTNSIPFLTSFGTRNSPNEGVIKLKNAWYLSRSIKVDDRVLVAYALLATDYGFENRYIENKWGKRINGAKNINLTLSEHDTQPLLFNDDSVAAYLRVATSDLEQSLSWSAGFWLMFLVLALLTVWYASNWLETFISKPISTWLFVGLLLLLRGLMQWWNLPKDLYALELFGPTLHASSVLIPSLGDFLLHLCFLMVIILRFSPLIDTENSNKFKHWLGVSTPVLLLWPVHYLFEILVVNSSFSFDLNNPFSLNLYSFIGLLVSFLILFNHYLLFRLSYRLVAKENRSIKKLLLPWFLAVVFILIALGGNSHAFLVGLPGGLAVGFLMLAQKWVNHSQGLSLYTPIILVFSLLACGLLSGEQFQNEKESRKALARKLDLQQNPITEYLFDDLHSKITSDRSLRNTLSERPMSTSNVLEALREPFTYDHWNLYGTTIDLYNADGGLMATDQQRTGPNYFELQQEFESSKPTLSKYLHYVGNGGHEGAYLARVALKGRRSQNDLILFVRLVPEKTNNLLGFTDLFIDEGVSTEKELEGYSYALYADSALQNRHGDFPYSLSTNAFSKFDDINTFVNVDGFSHLIYRPMKDRMVIVSRKREGIIGYLTIFSYLFLFYFACTIVVILAEGRMMKGLFSTRSFRNRINLAMSSMLFVSLLLIGLLTVFYVVQEYHARNEEMITEKSKSVLIEMEHKLRDRVEFEEDDQPMLAILLNKFSKVFFTDINLYGLDGHLLATSRPRLFDEGLMSHIMEPNAYNEMHFGQRSSFIQEETIGNLTYLTAYVPFRNEKREVIAFMSLPYFARQNGLQQEVFSLLAALTNIYVFLILISVVMALVISDRITEPLRFIRESLKSLKLNQTNRAIEWESDDEIGELVEEYNRTLNELVESAELLARSERESAWREMAKQVAHEIKNPLTPMKLSIQMLQRSKNDGAENLDERIDKVTNTLIEQIDTLSNIATEFSSFAQMPKSNLEHVDLRSILENAVELHGNQGVDIKLDVLVDGDCVVKVDKEQTLRVFNNLIKNGIQAIPEEKKGKINVALVRNEQQWEVAIKDNGSGIPSEIKERIFVPNFTTKSSGMGLGLAMVKNIVETANGKIWFETEENFGTTFRVSFPVIE